MKDIPRDYKMLTDEQKEYFAKLGFDMFWVMCENSLACTMNATQMHISNSMRRIQDELNNTSVKVRDVTSYKSFMDRLELEQNDPTHREVSDKLTNIALRTMRCENL